MQRRGLSGTSVGQVEAHADRLLREPASGLADAIVATLETVGRRLRADRVALWELGVTERGLRLVHQWARPGCGTGDATIGAEDVPWLLEQVTAGRRVTFRSSAALPTEAFRERKLFARHGPRSAAILPLVMGESTVAVLVVGTMRTARSWGPAAFAVMERPGAALVNALVRKRTHEAWVETEGRLAAVLEAAPGGILLVRPSGRIEFANASATVILLRTRQELCGERLQDLLAPPADAAWGAGRGALDTLLATDAPLPVRARCGDGSMVPVEVTLHELRTPGAPLLCCGLRDASEDCRAREETVRLRNELAFMGRTAMLAEMGAGIAHELKQPLTAILSNAETAERLLRASRPLDPAPVRDALADVVKETRRAADVLGRMRDMLRRRQVEQLPLDLAALLAGVARRFREEAVVRGVTLSIEVPDGLPVVCGDRVQLEQVVMNLVLNAFDALADQGAGPRTIVLRARQAQPDGVAVSVRDSGPGLDDAALAHAFDAFFTTKTVGLGMGLPISRSIVEAHGGRLLARNNAEGGATFEFHLPAAPTRRRAAAGKGVSP